MTKLPFRYVPVESSSRREHYYLLIVDNATGAALSCDCPGWRFNAKCHHITDWNYERALVISEWPVETQRRLRDAKQV